MACLTTGFAGALVAYASRGSIAFTTAFGVIGVTMAALALVGALGAGRLRLAAATEPQPANDPDLTIRAS